MSTLKTAWLPVAGPGFGWTLLPRLALSLCVPALIDAGAGAVSQLSRASLPASPVAHSIARSCASLALFFGMLAIVLTPVAAVLVLVVSVRRLWRVGVVVWLWIGVITASAMMLPALDAALGNWMVEYQREHGPAGAR